MVQLYKTKEGIFTYENQGPYIQYYFNGKPLDTIPIGSIDKNIRYKNRNIGQMINHPIAGEYARFLQSLSQNPKVFCPDLERFNYGLWVAPNQGVQVINRRLVVDQASIESTKIFISGKIQEIYIINLELLSQICLSDQTQQYSLR